MTLESKVRRTYESAPSSGSPEAQRRIIQAIDAAGTRIVEKRRRARMPRWTRIGFSVAAIVFVCVGAIQLQYWQVSDRLRGEGNDDRMAPVEGAILDGAPEVLRWPAQAGAESYEVVLRDGGGNVILEATTDSTVTVFEVPAAARNVLEQGGTFLWSVTAEGVVRRELGPVWFEVAAN